MPSNAATANTYRLQAISNRYIKISVLEAYLKAHQDTYGREWTLQVSRPAS